MGKTKKAKRGGGDPVRGQVSLPYQIATDSNVKGSVRNKNRYKGDDLNDDDVDDQYVSASITKKIIDQARLQQEELQEEHGVAGGQGASAAAAGAASRVAEDSSEEESDNEMPERIPYQGTVINLSKEDEEAFDKFRNPNPQAHQKLSDLFQEKLTEKKTEIMTQFSDASGMVEEEVPPALAALLRKTAGILATYSSGKLPKVLNMLPQMKNFEQLLMMLNPDRWSAAAMRAMTAKCMSTKPQRAMKFVRLVLLPRLRDDIQEYKKLNFHLYEALAKTLFKPKAFFGGIILPLCDEGDCTLREATIIASVISKVTIPPLHVATAIMLVADRPYTGASSIFLQALLGKKTSLPYSTIDSVVAHFVRFTLDKREMTVLWFQSLLTFVQHYRTEVTDEQRSELLHLCQSHRHHSITPEIYRQFEGCRVRGDAEDVEMR